MSAALMRETPFCSSAFPEGAASCPPQQHDDPEDFSSLSWPPQPHPQPQPPERALPLGPKSFQTIQASTTRMMTVCQACMMYFDSERWGG